MVTQEQYDAAMAKAAIASFQESVDFVAELEADLAKANIALEQVLDANEPSEAAYELVEDIELALEHYKDEPRVPVRTFQQMMEADGTRALRDREDSLKTDYRLDDLSKPSFEELKRRVALKEKLANSPPFSSLDELITD